MLENPLFKELMAEEPAMRDRFAAGPLYAKTGKGFLKSAGVAKLQKLEAAAAKERKP